LDCEFEGWRVVVIDDGSTVTQELDSGEWSDTPGVMARHLSDPRFFYRRLEKNNGLGEVFETYRKDMIGSEFFMLLNDDDFIFDGKPLATGINLLESDSSLSVAVFPLVHVRTDGNRFIGVPTEKMTGLEMAHHFINDEAMKHSVIYGMFRTGNLEKTGAFVSLRLRDHGLEDAFGIDTDLVFRMATVGGAGFVDRPVVHRQEGGGLTERFPLSFAYCYYRYTLHVLKYLRRRKFLERRYERILIRHWMRVMLMSYSSSVTMPNAEEFGESRIRRHLKYPLHIYILLQLIRFRMNMDKECWDLFHSTLKIIFELEKSIIKHRLQKIFKWPDKISKIPGAVERVPDVADWSSTGAILGAAKDDGFLQLSETGEAGEHFAALNFGHNEGSAVTARVRVRVRAGSRFDLRLYLISEDDSGFADFKLFGLGSVHGASAFGQAELLGTAISTTGGGAFDCALSIQMPVGCTHTTFRVQQLDSERNSIYSGASGLGVNFASTTLSFLPTPL